MNSHTPYRFNLLGDRGARNCLFIAQCFGNEHAVLLARTLFDSTFVRVKAIEVWRDDVLVHQASRSRNGTSTDSPPHWDARAGM